MVAPAGEQLLGRSGEVPVARSNDLRRTRRADERLRELLQLFPKRAVSGEPAIPEERGEPAEILPIIGTVLLEHMSCKASILHHEHILTGQRQLAALSRRGLGQFVQRGDRVLTPDRRNIGYRKIDTKHLTPPKHLQPPLSERLRDTCFFGRLRSCLKPWRTGHRPAASPGLLTPPPKSPRKFAHLERPG